MNLSSVFITNFSKVLSMYKSNIKHEEYSGVPHTCKWCKQWDHECYREVLEENYKLYIRKYLEENFPKILDYTKFTYIITLLESNIIRIHDIINWMSFVCYVIAA